MLSNVCACRRVCASCVYAHACICPHDMYVCVVICVHVCVYMYVCVLSIVCISAYVCMCVLSNVCMSACTCIRVMCDVMVCDGPAYIYVPIYCVSGFVIYTCLYVCHVCNVCLLAYICLACACV